MSLLDELINSVLGGTLTVSTLGGIPLEVISEKTRSLPVSVTSKRVEKGFNLTDTTRREQQIISITVVDNSLAYLENKTRLEELQAKGDIVEFNFAGKETYENLIIENIEIIESPEQKRGYKYFITLRQIQIGEVKDSDVQVDYKQAKSTGGGAKRSGAKVTDATNKEKERGKTGLRGLLGG